ncbi:FAD dependent oxidoreductase [Hymenobacter roseosalivarius DSM 11622]|uniref:FAD dependent oxidoreductase n=1 Tax=Hymenobacter roseosalivarius DSM 11622 TaxID=645990 RepID=A0A1W1V294_9BACT|nr:FAD-dependent oxidoreductase [Hymenobacter roseosalivarius]SMB87406.1 FAD dependent oxidoreductase [Hymenobacter roseosalivarius DSM 11622]
MTPYDYLILGHGLAGATLAYELRQRGHAVLVLDEPRPDSASNVAAGLMNPVTGQRFALTWLADELLPAAAVFYRKLEAEFKQQFFFETPILKLFSSVKEQNAILARSADQPWGAFVEKISTDLPLIPGVKTGLGGIFIRRCGYVAVREMLAALAAAGLQNGWLRHETFTWNELVVDPAGVTYKGAIQARHLVCCEGAAAMRNPYFSWLPIIATQGEVLDVQCQGLSMEQVLNKGGYVVPLGAGQFRVGATYRWPPFPFPLGITEEARTELRQRFAEMSDQPFQVVDQRAGIRPAVRDRKPLLGRHPAWPVLSIFNGFGSKGVMLAPRLATHFANVLEGTEALWPEVNISRYHSLYISVPTEVGVSS